MKNVVSSVVRPGSLSMETVKEMFRLMCCYFDGMNWNDFRIDLMEKQWVIILSCQDTGAVFGFSTLYFSTTDFNGKTIGFFFSGDTIIHRDYRGSLLLEREWLKLVFRKVEEEPLMEWYWFLVCKGYRTYRYLPVYFKSYFPSPGVEGERREKEILDYLAFSRFGNRYSRESGVVKGKGDYRLKQGVGEITPRLLNDPRIAFFNTRNPGWHSGDELACLVRLERNNLRRPEALEKEE